MIEINGAAHIILTVSQWDKSRDFYSRLCPFLGMTKVYDGNNFLYHVGGRSALGIQRCAEEFEGQRFQQNRVETALGQMQSGRKAGEAAADHADIAAGLAGQRRALVRADSGCGVVRVGVSGCGHGGQSRSSSQR